jgi:hypothetical protein
MNKDHHFQSQLTEDNLQLGSQHRHSQSKARNGKAHGATAKASHDEIAKEAFNLFSQRGYIPGHDVEQWLQAEAQLNMHLPASIRIH